MTDNAFLYAVLLLEIVSLENRMGRLEDDPAVLGARLAHVSAMHDELYPNLTEEERLAGQKAVNAIDPRIKAKAAFRE